MCVCVFVIVCLRVNGSIYGVLVYVYIKHMLIVSAQLIRSGVLRNDIAIIIFQEYGQRYNPESMRSKLNRMCC